MFLCECVCVCMHAPRPNPTKFVLSSILLLALMSQQKQASECVPQVQRAEGALAKGISSFDALFIA